MNREGPRKNSRPFREILVNSLHFFRRFRKLTTFFMRLTKKTVYLSLQNITKSQPLSKTLKKTLILTSFGGGFKAINLGSFRVLNIIPLWHALPKSHCHVI